VHRGSLTQLCKEYVLTTKPSIRQQMSIAILVALATGLHLIESLLPALPFSGAKLGLANIATLVGLNLFGPVTAFSVSIIRSFLGTLLGGILFGPGFWMSFIGSGASAVTMAAASRVKFLTNVGVSVVGAITHATSQLIVAVQLTNHVGLWGYYPLLLGLSVVTGVFTGIATTKILALLPAPDVVRRTNYAEIN